MKKLVLSLTLPAMALVFMSFSSGNQSTNQEQLANDGVKITCPDGDKYICYKANGIQVYKGAGEATVEIDR